MGRRSGGAHGAGKKSASRGPTKASHPSRSNCPPHHWLMGAPELNVVTGCCLKCGRERVWEQPTYGKYESTPAILRDPLLDRLARSVTYD